MATNSILGRESLDLGPANVYVKKRFDNSIERDWESDSDYVFLGKSEMTMIRVITTKTDLVASQDGTRPSDKVVTAQQVQVQVNMGQPTLERLQDIQQGMRYELDTSGDIEQFKIVDVLGERDSDANVELWVKVVKINAGVESTDELDTIYCKAAPATDQVELTYDAATQRFYAVTMEAYKNESGSYAVSFVENGATKYAYAWSAVA